MMAVNVDRQSGVMNISVTTYNSLLSTDIARNFLNNLSRRIQEIETKKARENLKFIEDRFLEVQKDLIVAEEQLARFTDSNLNVRTAKLRIEMERYQRNVTFKTQLYASSFLFSWTKRFKKHRSEDLIRTQDEFNQNIRV